MSLVNLAHVCSHLQNASLARLGLTSIPYTKLHLSLALLLHKQGFLSQVKIGGLSPPASCFPPGARNNNRITAQPHIERDAASVARGYAELKKELSKEQLERDGWDRAASDFVVQNRRRSRPELEEAGYDRELISLIEKYHDYEFEEQVKQQILRDHLSTVYPDTPLQYLDSAISDVSVEGKPLDILQVEQSLKGIMKGSGENEDYIEAVNLRIDPQDIERQLRQSLLKQGFEEDELKLFAREQRFVTPRHLAQDGVSVDVMGLTVTNQPFTPVPEQYQDPSGLEEEGIVTQANRASRRLWLGLKYWEGQPVLSKARMVSKPTKRIWLNHFDIGKVVRGKNAGEVKPMTQIGEIIAVGTDRGILEARECVERKIGGQLLCRIW